MVKTVKTKVIVNDILTKKLIREVKSRPYIWNSTHERYNDRMHVAKAWSEISKALALPGFTLKAKWKNLRDVFKREWKKLQMESAGHSHASTRTRWRHFQDMLFIKMSEPADDNIFNLEPLADANVRYDIKIEAEEYPSEEQSEIYVDSIIEDSNMPNAKRENLRLNCYDNYDMMYLQSLTPFLSELEPMRKLAVRNKIQELLMMEISAQNEERARSGRSAT